MPVCIKKWLRSLAYILCVSFALVSTQAMTQNTDAERSPIQYRIQKDDTAALIVARYLSGQDALAVLKLANPDHDMTRLVVGQMIQLPRQVIRYQRATALVSYLKCNEPITIRTTNAILRIGTVIEQHDVIQIPSMCQLSLTFEDKSTVRMPSGGTIEIQTLRKNPFERSPEVNLALLDGNIEVKVPKRQKNDATFQVRTPNSVAGVRGTEFRVGFDRASGKGTVEVSAGLVGARGVDEREEKNVSAQYGVAIAADGESGDVEKLPAPVQFESVHAQQDPSWFLFVFKRDPNAASYAVRQYATANPVNAIDTMQYQHPRFLSMKTTSTAQFLDWTGKTKSGLSGDRETFGICASETKTPPFKCDVRFDLDGLDNATLKISKVTENQTIQPLVKSAKAVKNMKQAIVKGLSPGRYKWEIEYTIANGKTAQQSGAFELVAVASPGT
jgi:hypothetical protein